jgi:hypothetical protein
MVMAGMLAQTMHMRLHDLAFRRCPHVGVDHYPTASPLCHSQKNQNVFLDLWSQCNCRPSFISILLGVQILWMDMYEGTGFNSIEDPGWTLSM